MRWPALSILGVVSAYLLGTITRAAFSWWSTNQVNQGLLDGQLAWRQHDGGHTDAPNIETFIAWANQLLSETQPLTGATK